MGFNISIGSGGGFIGKLFSSAFGMVFVIVGVLIVRSEWHDLQETKAMQAWDKTTCSIISCEVEDYGEDFRLVLSYSYTVDGKTYTGHQYGRDNDYTADTIVKIKQAQSQWEEGKQVDCFYNPGNPSQAVLNRSNPAADWIGIGFTLLFPAGGLLFVVLPWRSVRRKKPEYEVHDTASKSLRAVPIIFGLVFTIIGLAMIKPLMIKPLLQACDARSWVGTLATVVSSKVKSHSDDDGTTYSAYIAYRYEVDGKEYFGDRLNLMKVSSSGYESKAEIVRQYPEGREINVFVNPKDPSESVIDNEASLSLLFCLFPLPFLIMGLFVLGYGLRNKKPKLDMAQSQEHIVELKAASPKTKVLFLVPFTTIWLTVVYFLIGSDAPRLFPVAFGLIGLFLIGATVYTILSLFNPKPTVELTPGNLHPGTNMAMRWRINGRTDRIRSLKITLRCLKVVTETRRSGGESETRTIKEPLHEDDIHHTENQAEIAQGTLQFTIPADYPASRPGNYNGIEWQLRFYGDIPRWPDMNTELPFIVYPTDAEASLTD